MTNRTNCWIQLGCILWGLTLGLGAQDWPHWRGLNRDGKVAGLNVGTNWPKELTLKWRKTIGLGDATPALVGDRLFVFGRQGEEEVILGLEAGSGEPSWRYAYSAAAVTGPAEKYQGPRSSLAVSQGKVVALGVGGVLTCLEAATGSLLWQHAEFIKPVPLFFTAMSPLVTENRCVAHLGGAKDGVVALFDLATGKPVWEWRGEGPSYSSPTLITVGGVSQVVVHTETGLMGLSLANGRRLWRILTPAKPGYWTSASPVIDAPYIYYTGQGTGTRCVEIVKQGDTFIAKECWHNALYGTVYNTPVLLDGLIYALSDRGQFFSLEARTGELAWSDTNRVSNFGSLLLAGSVLAALPEKSGLILFQPNRHRFEEVARYKLSDDPIYAFPVFSGNRVYVRDARNISMYEGIPARTGQQ